MRLWTFESESPIWRSKDDVAARSIAIHKGMGEEAHFAVGRVNGTVDVFSGRERTHHVPTDLGAIHGMVWAGDSVVMATESGAIAWLSGDQLAATPMDLGPLLSVDVHPDGSQAAIGHGSGAIVAREWWSPRKHTLPIPQRPLGSGWSVEWAAEGPLLVAGGDSLWFVDAPGQARCIAESEMRQMRITAAALSPNSERIVYSHGLELTVIDRNGKMLERLGFGGHTAPPTDIVWLSDKTTASVDQGGDMILWTLGERAERRSVA